MQRTRQPMRRLTTHIFILLFSLSASGTSPLALDDSSKLYIDTESPSSCEKHLEKKHTDDYLQKEIESFTHLAEEALALRAETIKFGKQLQVKAHQGLPLSGEDMDILSFGLATHLKLREQLMEIAESHECWLSMSEKDLVEAGLSSKQQLEGVMLSLASALVMYDNYLHTATLFEGDAKLRLLLNEGDQGYQLNKAELTKVSLSYNSAIKRARVRRAMRFYENVMASGGHADVNQYLSTLIDQSPSYDMVREWSPLHVVGKKIGVYSNITTDSFAELRNEGVSLFSMLFGNAVGLVETRKGKLYARTDVHKELRDTLQCGDILLEKTPFRLTDKLIPGYWGHAAVWIGTEKELRDLGLWEHPLVQKYHEEIRGGRLVAEALRSGVELNPLAQFLNVDSMGIVRRPNLTKEELKQIVLQTLRQVGKKYDFNFDVESIEKVYCSKLIYLAYNGISWSVNESFGRTTFTPDDVASEIFKHEDLKLVSFYNDGKKIREEPVSLLASLMGVPAR